MKLDGYCSILTKMAENCIFDHSNLLPTCKIFSENSWEIKMELNEDYSLIGGTQEGLKIVIKHLDLEIFYK